MLSNSVIRSAYPLAACLCLLTAVPPSVTGAELNDGWRFHLGEISGAHLANYDDAGWQRVSLPHTPRIEALVTDAAGPDSSQWQGICWYRKQLSMQANDADKVVWLKLDGAMRVADFWVNGHYAGRHVGGYLPAVVDITRYLLVGGQNVIAIRLDNFDNPITGPKPMVTLDFNFYGGLYREAELVVKDRLHITDPILADKAASGGVFISSTDIRPDTAKLRVQTHVENEHPRTRQASIRTTVFDADGLELAVTKSDMVSLGEGQDSEFVQNIDVADPRLWSLTDPHLYTVQTELVSDGKVVDRQESRYGIRHISISADGFTLNGEKVFLRGTNRHQEYPYIGYALSDAAQYRDARRIKDAGFDYIRLSHYPHAPAFLDACDELGLVVMNCIMGWQYFADTEEFKEQQYQQCRDLVRRDRNHPCVILWETSLNESGMTKEFIRRTHAIAHEEYPSDQCYTAGWTLGYDVFIQARQHGGCREVSGRPCLVSEYGDWEYFAQDAGLAQEKWRHLSSQERDSRQLRGQGEAAQLQQALNFQEAHNDNLKTTAFADGLWVMFDYNRGYSNDLESSGCIDIFRLPKFSYYFFQSQRPADEDLADATSGPMVFVANCWTPESTRNVRVFSNCEQVELYLNDRLIDRRGPDDDRVSTHLASPPFTFELAKFEPGELRAVGISGGVAAAEHVRHTPGVSAALELHVDLAGKEIQAGKNDAVFVRASVVDAGGNVVPTDTRQVSFTIHGDAEVIGPSYVAAEAGIATILLRGPDQPATISITASAIDLADARTTVEAVTE